MAAISLTVDEISVQYLGILVPSSDINCSADSYSLLTQPKSLCVIISLRNNVSAETRELVH